MNHENDVINYPNSLEEIALYGHEAQARLEQISTSMAGAIISNQDVDSFIEKYIDDLQSNVSFLEKEQEETIRLFSFFGKNHFRKNCQLSIEGLDQLKTLLQLEQARQVKQLNVLKRIETMAQDCCSCLESFVQAGNAFMQSNNRLRDADPESFCQRFQQRLDSLNMSYTIALQTSVQIKLLQQLSSSLADKLQDAVTHLIPLWRNQISLLYGIQKNKTDSSDIQKEVRRGLSKQEGGSIQKILDLDQSIIRFLQEIQRSNKTIAADNLSFTDIEHQIKSTKDKKGENDDEE